MHKAQRLINHVALVLDGSSSMHKHSRNLIKVADEQIRHLALRSEELSQETRVSVYLFDYDVTCLIFDMDVMRLPSIADLYRANGMTALVDSVVKSQEDLKTTSQIYGDHAFLTFILTDGMENHSQNSWTVLPKYTDAVADNWTVGFLVPDRASTTYLNRAGVPDGLISQWDASSERGLADSFTTIRSATDNFMAGRAKGVRGTRDVFGMGVDVLNKKTVPTTLNALSADKYRIFPVKESGQIRDFVEAQGFHYKAGMGYYRLSKRETIGKRKQIVVVEKASDKAYHGQEARHLLGLPDGQDIRVSPQDNPEYDVYVQSTSVNRKLVPGTHVLVIK